MSRELQTINQQNKLALWAGRISECRSSGQNVKVWCKENGICEQTYYRWQKMKAAEGITEALKASDPMTWVQRMNNIRARAEEIIREELIYV